MKEYYIDKKEDKFEDLNKEEQGKLLEWIKENFTSTKNINNKTYSSYGLKHIIQKQEGLYVTNEQFKKAMLLCGFNVGNPHNRNWYFNVSQKSPALLYVKEIGGI